MATLARRQIAVVGTVSGNQPGVRVYEPVASLTIAAGNIVVENAGKFDLSATPVPAADTVLGVVMHDVKQGTAWHLGDATVQEATGGTFGGTFMGASNLLGSVEGIGGHVASASDDNIFEIGVDSALALADLGAQVQLELLTAIWEANIAGATKSAVIIALPNYEEQAIGDTNARVWVQFLPAASLLF